MSAPTKYFITGANRGIGKGFVQTFLKRPSTTVIAAVRDPSSATAKSLQTLPTAAGSKLITVKVDSAIEDDATKAVAQIQEQHGITSLDVIIANAGASLYGTTVRKTTVKSATEHFVVNATGPLTLFQATTDLLQASKTGNPTFVAISTLIGSMGFQESLAGVPNFHSPYGSSKAALNWFIRRIHFEEPWLTSFVFHPGVVATEFGAETYKSSNLEPSHLGAISIDTSVSSMVKVIDKATRDISGTFQNYDGTVLPW
ncbi:hypothetical protein F5X99DRAFT_396344 [Biscogniauxia marginata]|nr:hypothetical protein F5X99DRAFT_396344 [Biscogniauxia marginata]